MNGLSAAPPQCAPRPIVVMGVSGSGKSLVGAALARALNAEFVDGDDLHPEANIDKMRRGEALDDADRAPWLRAVAAVIGNGAAHPHGLVIACSALKRAYRESLRAAEAVHFVFLDADRTTIERRFEQRQPHVMPRALIASQFDALERPDRTESDVMTVDAALPCADIVDAVREQSILRSWRSNAPAWAQAIRENRVASRTLVTNRAIIDTLLGLEVHRILDVGCGEGWLSRALAAEGIESTGVDAEHSLIAEARRLGGDFDTLNYADLSDGRFERRGFDAAVCNFSLLGEDSVARLCPALRRYLAPAGYLVIQTLHPMSVGGDYRDGWRAGSWSGFGSEFTDPAPWYFRTVGSWVALLQRSGYTLVDCREPCALGASAPSSIIFVGRAGPA